jgi:hypothetical protein
MSRGLSIFALLLLAVVSFGLYQLSYQVQDLEDELVELNRALGQERETIGVLQAEWSYLTGPEYLQDKAQRLLAMRSATAQDIVTIEALPWRQDRGEPQQPGAGKLPQMPALPPMASAPPASKAAPALAAAPAPAAPQLSPQLSPIPVSAKVVPGEAMAKFDSEVAAVLSAMQNSGKAAGKGR